MYKAFAESAVIRHLQFKPLPLVFRYLCSLFLLFNSFSLLVSKIYKLFFIRTSKFCWDSLFLIFGCLFWQPRFVLNLFLFLWTVWNDGKSKPKDKALKNKCWSSVFWGDLWLCTHLCKKWETVLLCFYCAHCERKLQDSVKFQLETFSVFFSLGLSLFCS